MIDYEALKSLRSMHYDNQIKLNITAFYFEKRKRYQISLAWKSFVLKTKVLRTLPMT